MSRLKGKGLQLDGYEICDSKSAYLGEGTYGTVFQATQVATGRTVAIKQHHLIAYEPGVSPCVLRETTVLRFLKNSPYVVKLLDVVHDEAAGGGQAPLCHMIFEHLDCDLSSYMREHRPMRPNIIQRIMYQILMGVHHCHHMGLMHRDLKPPNILMDVDNPERPQAKLCDFGFGRTFTVPIRRLTQEIITLWYRPPEVLLGYQSHSPSVDVWSAGCILAELYEGAVLFRGKCQYEQLIKIFEVLGTPSDEVWRALPACEHWHEFPMMRRKNLMQHLPRTPVTAINLLEQMIQYDPAERISTEQCLRHPYFASVFKEVDLQPMPLLHSDMAREASHRAGSDLSASAPAVLPRRRSSFHPIAARPRGSY